MAVSITWATKVIFIPKADLSVIGGGVYGLDLEAFREELKALEASEYGMAEVDTHVHNTTVLISGVTYARLIQIINGYTVTFEDGQYAVNATGANSNLADVLNVNQVSLRSFNSAGLQVVTQGSGVTEQDKDDIALKVRDQGLLSAAAAGTMGRAALLAAYAGNQGPGIYVDSYYGSDPASPSLDEFHGVKARPVKTAEVAKTLATALGARTFYIVGLMTLESTFYDFDFYGNGMGGRFDAVNTNNQVCWGSSFTDLRVTGEFPTGQSDGSIEAFRCAIHSIDNITGVFRDCAFSGANNLPVGAYTTSYLTLINCCEDASMGTGYEPSIGCGGPAGTDVRVGVTGWRGRITFTGIQQSANAQVYVGCDGAVITFDSTCTAALTVPVFGDKRIIVEAGANVIIDDDGGTDAIVADAVWDEAAADHETTGSFGWVSGIIKKTVSAILGNVV